MTVTMASALMGVQMHTTARGELHVRITGRMDDRSGPLLSRVGATAARFEATHLTLDLRDLDGFTAEGVTAATACCRAALDRRCGVEILASGPASDELLAILPRREAGSAWEPT